MIRIAFATEPSTTEWEDWREKCAEAQRVLDKSHQDGKPEDATELYKKMRLYLDLNGPFFGKCAYCESKIAENQPGDIDHYRPKGRVHTADNDPVMVAADNGTQKPHPGYYWLAYHWQNLLPACADCNRPSSQKTGGTLIGKWDQFPIADESFRARKAGDEAQERPLLLNPTNPDLDLDEHLKIDDTGVLTSNTLEGNTTIEMLGLNKRLGLVSSRMDEYSNAYKTVLAAIMAVLDDSPKASQRKKELEIYANGSARFAMAGRAGMCAALSRLNIFDALRSQFGL